MKTIEATNFIEQIINDDIENGKITAVQTRFPPEPNGYLHIGHVKSMLVNFGTAKKYEGKCNLFFDDTNPSKEKTEFVNAIRSDIEWVGYDWAKEVYASNFFDVIYEYAEKLILDGKAFVCDLSPEEISATRGTLTEAGKNSPYRERSVEENLQLFREMRAGKYPDGSKCLRAKIDMASPNINLRDPVIYRIKHIHHHRQGDEWCVYPMYDFAHPIQDALEGITHSLCSSEFRNHRPLYDWVVNKIGFEQKPHQWEFGRMNITYTVMSKRYLRQLVEEGHVDGWDDPRLPTLCGLRRRGYTPAALFNFVREAGVTNTDHTVDVRQLEACVRDDLNENALRRIAIANPIKVIIDNYPEDKEEMISLPNHPQKEEFGRRDVPMTREIYIDADDFAEVPPPKFFRLKPDGEVRLMGGYIIKYAGIEKNEDGSIRCIHASADLETGNGMPKDGRKIKGTIHWLSAKYAKPATLMLYDRLFNIENTAEVPEGKTYLDFLNPDSLTTLDGAMVEPSLESAAPGEKFQFVRVGYFCKDTKNEGTFNRVVGLKDSFPKNN